MRVQITKLPLGKAAYGKQVDGSLSLKPGAFGGGDYNASNKTNYKGVRDTVSEVSRDEANLEAEGGETAFGPITGQSIPDHLKIRGKRHHEGGVPLNLPDDTFIFSDTASLRINDPNVLAMFNKIPKKGGYTPAELAKPYNINKYKAILLDPDSSKLERDTAIIMIKNYIMKLGALALVQESMKGFPQGIPEMAKPYMEANGISEEDLLPELKEQADALEQAMSSGQQTGMPQEENPMMAQEMEQMDPQQAMQAQQAMMSQGQEQPAYPEQMPSGAPVASPEMMAQMQGSMPPPEMMQQPGMMAYGGMPYAMYGMEMGGFYPEYAFGGDMPRFQGPDNSQVGGPEYVVVNGKRVPASKATTLEGEGTRMKTESGKEAIYRKQAAAERQEKLGQAKGSGTAPNAGWSKAICDALKAGQTVESLAAKGHGTVAGLKAKFADCITEAEEKFKEKEEAFFIEPEKQDEAVVTEPKTEEKETLTCKCTDPVTGQTTSYAITSEEECMCQDGSQGQVGQGMANIPTPHWSRPARTNVMRNALMMTRPAPSNVVLTGRAQTKGAYEEYQTKVDTAQAAVNALQNAVMTGMAGSTGAKQAQMKDLLGKSLRASMSAVADVQSRNVDRQRETNTQNATIDNTNMMANTQIMNQGLALQKANRDQEIANKNLRRYNTMGAAMEADKEMALRQNTNILTPQYASEYELGFIAPTGVEKPLTGANGQSFEDRIQYYLGKTGDYDSAFDKAYKEARLKPSQYGGQRMANGGYILASNVFPFII